MNELQATYMDRTLRLNRYLAACGLTSRRKADQLIAAGRISVNGRTVQELGIKVVPGKDRIEVDGKLLIPSPENRYYAFHKPAGYLCSRGDPFGRLTIYNILPKNLRDLKYVGRLDRDTEGLLLLTDDGDLIQKLTHPRYGVRRIYLVQILGRMEERDLLPLRQGITYEGETYRPARMKILDVSPVKSTIEVEILEGRKREVRVMFRALGRTILNLRRTMFGPIELGGLPPGKVRRLSPEEISALKSSPV